MLLAVYDHPSIVGTPVCRAMNVMDPGNETAFRWKKCLPVSIDLCVYGCCNDAIQIVIRYHFDQAGVAIRKSYLKRQYLMAAMWSSALRARSAHSNATYHDIVDGRFLIGTQQFAQLLIHLRSTA